MPGLGIAGWVGSLAATSHGRSRGREIGINVLLCPGSIKPTLMAAPANLPETHHA